MWQTVCVIWNTYLSPEPLNCLPNFIAVKVHMLSSCLNSLYFCVQMNMPVVIGPVLLLLGLCSIWLYCPSGHFYYLFTYYYCCCSFCFPSRLLVLMVWGASFEFWPTERLYNNSKFIFYISSLNRCVFNSYSLFFRKKLFPMHFFVI